MAEISELFEPLRFPGDDYVIRMNATQVLQMCALMHGIKQSSPEQFQDPNVAMTELQFAHQAYMHQLMHGADDAQKQAAQAILPEIREKMLLVRRVMERAG